MISFLFLLTLSLHSMAATPFKPHWQQCQNDQDCILLVGSGKEKLLVCRWLSVNKSSKQPYRKWEKENGIVLIGTSCERDFDKEIRKLKAVCRKQTCEVEKL